MSTADSADPPPKTAEERFLRNTDPARTRESYNAIKDGTIGMLQKMFDALPDKIETGPTNHVCVPYEWRKACTTAYLKCALSMDNETLRDALGITSQKIAVWVEKQTTRSQYGCEEEWLVLKAMRTMS